MQQIFRGVRDVSLLILISGLAAFAQDQKPGLTGMACPKWLTIRNTHAPGKVYSFPTHGKKSFTQEEFYVRAWLPVVHGKKLTVLLGPNYRSEQLEFKSDGENPVHSMGGWNLRTFGVDLNGMLKLSENSWLIVTSHFNKSGNFEELKYAQIPVNYTVSATYLKKKSESKEIGAGVIISKRDRITPLPVFIFNYNYSSKGGIEMLLPKKVAWRNNLSASDILYVRAETVSRNYYISPFGDGQISLARRLDIDMGVAYNKRLGKYAGFEIFGGYRQNISNRLVSGAYPVKVSGLAATVEFYIQPPRFGKKNPDAAGLGQRK